MTELLKNRLIGFFDVLGFSTALKSRDIEELHSEYAQLIDIANTTIFSSENILDSTKSKIENFSKSQFLFDSLVLVSHEASDPIKTCNYILSCLSLMNTAFSKGFFLRGSITIGDILFDEDRNIFLSSAFPSLLDEEKNQEWCGCTIEKKAENLVLNSIYGMNNHEREDLHCGRTHPLVKYPVVRKGSTNIYPSWCLNWVSLASNKDLNANLVKLTEPKKANTIDFIDWIQRLPSLKQTLPDDALPALYFETIKTRGAIVVIFKDKNGDCVDLPDGCSISFQVQ